MAEEVRYMTQEGWDALEKEYRNLIDVEQPKVKEQLALARSQGDLSENADYSSAREHQSEIEARIKEIEHIRDIAKIIKVDPNSKSVQIGHTVTYIETANGQKHKVRIGGTDEADPFAEPPVISNQSPLGAALISKRKGETAMVEADEPYEIEIIELDVTGKK